MGTFLRSHIWMVLTLVISISVGAVNRLAPFSTFTYYPEKYLSLSQELRLYAWDFGGSPLPLSFAIPLCLVGILCLALGRFRPFTFRLLRFLGFLAIILAWTPTVAFVIGLFAFFIFLGWIISGMGVERKEERRPSLRERLEEASSNVGTPEEYRAFWRLLLHPSYREYRSTMLWAFGVCWFLSLLLFLYYLHAPAGFMIRAPEVFSEVSLTVPLAAGIFVAPMFLGAFIELLRERRSDTLNIAR